MKIREAAAWPQRAFATQPSFEVGVAERGDGQGDRQNEHDPENNDLKAGIAHPGAT
jgi:hypothetical protein